jgi:release factor glutamine methyltransferase
MRPDRAARGSVREALADAAARLAATSPSARLDAELLMAHALETSREALILNRLDDRAPEAFEALVARREDHEPVAYIVGRRAFWTIELEVGPGALVPRADSETLIEAAIERFGAAGPASILDLGTGPGTLLLAALDQWPRARGIGVDRSSEALDYAERNARRLGLKDRAQFRVGDWTEGLEARFDLVLANPPYVAAGAVLAPDVAAFEPAGALYAGADGLDDHVRLAGSLAAVLAPGGFACVEIGAGQEQAARALYAAAGFSVSARPDLAGIARCLVLVLD